MSDPEGLSRQDLYANWLAWVTTNLGADANQAAAAANAAADAAVHGDGFTAAENAALLAVETVPGSRGRGGRSFLATYQFEFQGRQQSTSDTYWIEDSVRQNVVVLFYPRLPRFAKVLPELLNPSS